MNVLAKGLLLRLVFFFAISCLLVVISGIPGFWATKVLLLLLILGTGYNIIRYALKPEKQISDFVENLRFSNDIPVFSKDADDNEEDIIVVFRKIADTIRRIKFEKQAEYDFFKAVSDHLATALLVYSQDGTIRFCNRSALQLLQMPRLDSLAQLKKKNPGLAKFLLQIRPATQSFYKTLIDGESVKLSVRSEQVQHAGELWNIVTLQDIRDEIAREETEAWQKIIRILAHEIVNSTSPINMLTVSLSRIVQKNQWSDEDRQNMETGLQAIEKRSRGMTAFVENYRTMTSVPEPEYALTNIKKLMERLDSLFKEEMEMKNIDMIISIRDVPPFRTDERLLEQVFINLIRNAVESFGEKPGCIRIEVQYHASLLEINVMDNGCGIDPGQLEVIFTPFYTTRKGGTGIGLFISRKIIQTLNGSLTAQSSAGNGSVFTIRLR